MRITIKIMITTFLISVWAMPMGAQAQKGSSTHPTLNHGQKWRIGYYEGGPYFNYPLNLRTLLAGLVDLGWIAPLEIPEVEDKTISKPIWDFLVQHARSDYLEFVGDAYWTADWITAKRLAIKEALIQRLNKKKDIDFMIAMGTWAGQDLANNLHHTPTMAVSVSDAVRSGISATAEDSGLDHVHAKCDPTRDIRQIRLFHRLAKFKRLGVVYDNTVEGRTYAALDDLYKVSRERNFSLVTCQAPVTPTDGESPTDKIIQCHEELAQKVDAVFVTVHRGIDKNRMKELIAPFLEHHIPTWSQRGPEEVEWGLLFSTSRGGFKTVGRFHAEVMARVFNGEKPRQIEQIFEDPKLIAINTKMAAMIGFDVPHSIMRIAGEVYETIEE